MTKSMLNKKCIVIAVWLSVLAGSTGAVAKDHVSGKCVTGTFLAMREVQVLLGATDYDLASRYQTVDCHPKDDTVTIRLTRKNADPSRTRDGEDVIVFDALTFEVIEKHLGSAHWTRSGSKAYSGTADSESEDAGD